MTPGGAKRIVIKLGTGVLTSGDGLLDAARIADFARRRRSSGPGGRRSTSFRPGPSDSAWLAGAGEAAEGCHSKQACAAVGQSLLMQTWQDAFRAARPDGRPGSADPRRPRGRGAPPWREGDVAPVRLRRHSGRQRKRHRERRGDHDQVWRERHAFSIGVQPRAKRSIW